MNSVTLDSSAIAAAKCYLRSSLLSFPLTEVLPYPEAIAKIELQLPALPDVETILTWANAVEEVATELPAPLLPWVKALQDEGSILRFRAFKMPLPASEI